MITSLKEFILIKEDNNSNYIDLHKYNLDALFDKINKDCFGGELKKCPILLKVLKHKAGMYRYRIFNDKNAYPKTYNDKIILSTLCHWTEQKLKNVLCHEMLHYWVSSRYNPKSGHDGQWLVGMYRINKLNIGYTITQYDDDKTEINTDVVKPLAKELFFFTGKYNGGICWAVYDYNNVTEKKEKIKSIIKRYNIIDPKFYTTKSIVTKLFTKFSVIGKFNITYPYIPTYTKTQESINSIINDPSTIELTDF